MTTPRDGLQCPTLELKDIYNTFTAIIILCSLRNFSDVTGHYKLCQHENRKKLFEIL